MPQVPQRKAHQVRSLGETPAEARARMKSERGAEVEQPQAEEAKVEPQGQEVEGPLTPAHLAAIEAAEGGFSDTGVSDGPPQEVDELAEPPTPEKALEVIKQISQEKNQLQAELDGALQLVQRYRLEFGDID